MKIVSEVLTNFTYDFAKIDDKVPMIEFLESLSIKERAKIFAYIEKAVSIRKALRGEK